MHLQLCRNHRRRKYSCLPHWILLPLLNVEFLYETHSELTPVEEGSIYMFDGEVNRSYLTVSSLSANVGSYVKSLCIGIEGCSAAKGSFGIYNLAVVCAKGTYC